MTDRIAVSATSPEGYRKVNSLDSYIGESLDAELLNFVYLRASLINGCPFCIDMHSVDLQGLGVPVRKICSVSVWREATWFTPHERAALALTEAITDIGSGVPDEVWRPAAAVFSEKELGDLVLAIGTINLWNRIAIATQMRPQELPEESSQ